MPRIRSSARTVTYICNLIEFGYNHYHENQMTQTTMLYFRLENIIVLKSATEEAKTSRRIT